MDEKQRIARRIWPLLLVGTIVGGLADASELQAVSSVDLHRACLAYRQSRDSAEGRTCAAYLRGFVDGSRDVVVQVPTGSQRSAFRERALRTRLGRPKDVRPTYCIDGATSMQQLVNQLLEQARSMPPQDDVDASVLIVATLGRYHPCAK